jgi:alkylhydroperoxidase family enzyme
LVCSFHQSCASESESLGSHHSASNIEAADGGQGNGAHDSNRTARLAEWGVHVAFFAAKAELVSDQIRSLTHGVPLDPCWVDPVERALIAAVVQLCDGAVIDDTTWAALSSHLSDAQLLDLCMLAGWYHAISFTARSAAVPLEQGAPRFADYV